MDIFTTQYTQRFEDTIRSLNFTLLLKLAGANASKFECFRPIINGLPTQKIEQMRKAEFVELLINLLQAGVNFNSLPTGCNCSDLAGSVCDASGVDYSALVAGINSTSPNTVPLTSALAASTTSYDFTIPAGRRLASATVVSPAGLTNTSIHIQRVSGITGAITVHLDEAPTSGTPSNITNSYILVNHVPVAQ